MPGGDGVGIVGHMPSHDEARLVEELASLEVFWRCSPAELHGVARVAKRMWVEPGEQICREGHEPDECFVVADGEVDVVVAGRRVARHGRGEIVGELGVIDWTVREASIVAVDRAVLLRIPATAFTQLLDAPGVAAGVLRQLAARLRSAQSKTGSPLACEGS